jgi:hypothetical protein
MLPMLTVYNWDEAYHNNIRQQSTHAVRLAEFIRGRRTAKDKKLEC